MEKTILLTLTYLVGLGELILAGFFWRTHSNNEIRKVMALLAFSTGMWVMFSAFTAYHPNEGVFEFANKFVFVFGIFLLTTLLFLVLIFPYPLAHLDHLHKKLLYTPAVIFSIAAIGTKSLQLGATGNAIEPGQVIPGPLYSIYNIVLLAIYIVAVMILFIRVKRLDGLHRRNTKILLLGVLLGGLPAVYVDLIQPLILSHSQINYLFGVMFTGFWLGAVIYVIQKK